MAITSIIHGSPREHRSKNGDKVPRSKQNIERTTGIDGITLITFNRKDSSANIFDKETLLELNSHLDAVEKEQDLTGVVFSSGKEKIFIAGADIKSIIANPDAVEIDRMIALGQETFSRIEALKIPTVAGIHGACLGGGFELALACDYRIASPDKPTKIGLPETQLGIIPAWGGTTRLPRLIGLPKALGLILPGKTIAATHAKKLGIVDDVVARENILLMAAKRIAVGKRPPLRKHRLWNNRISRAALSRQARSKLEAKTRGHYPAAPKALEVATKGITQSLEKSLALERSAVASLVKSPVTMNLVNVFLLQERAKKRKITDLPREFNSEISQTAVIGAGVMGAGIAQWLAARGARVSLVDIEPDAVAGGLATIRKLNGQAVKRRIMSKHEAGRAMDRITPVPTRIPLTNTDLIIEAAVEDLELKKKIFADLDSRAGEKTILATNTSALPIGEIARATTRPDKVLGLHFFNPVHRMKLVELVVTEDTSPEASQVALGYIKRIGKLPIVVKDSPGFLVNRILMPYLIDAGWLFSQGVPAENIDNAMLEFGMPMGPLRLLDEVGLDVALHVGKTLNRAFGERLALPDLLHQLVDTKQFGKKSGAGFYLYGKKGSKPRVNPKALESRPHDMPSRQFSNDELAGRMAALMVNEASACLAEEIIDSAKDVDFGMIMGTGFAPFLGGPLRYADSIGASTVVQNLGEAAADEEENGNSERFRPSPLLLDHAQKDTPFHSE